MSHACSRGDWVKQGVGSTKRAAEKGCKMSDMMTWTPVHTVLETGTNAAIYTVTPETPRAVVHINHGMAEHAARYRRFASALVTAGYAVVAQDHRGHGATTAQGASLGYFGQRDGWEKVCADAEAVSDIARERFPDTPVITFGHSMGAILALNLAMRRPEKTDAVAVWNSGVENGPLVSVLRGLLKVQKAFKGSDTPSALAKSLTFDTWNKQFAPNRTGFDWLSRDDREVDDYVADPLCGFPVTTGMWLDVLKGVRFGADDANLPGLPKALPVHLLAGAADPCSENGQAITHIAERMKRAGMRDVTKIILPDTRHESLNEINRDETTRSFVTWLDARFA